MFNTTAVVCPECNQRFNVNSIDGKLIGRYICPHCGVPYIEPN